MFKLNISFGKSKEAVNAAPKKGKRLSEQVEKAGPETVNMKQNALRTAIDNARDKNNPSWVELRRIYEKTETDSHVLSHTDTSINKVQGEDFIISKNGVDSEELTQLFKRPWFDQFVEVCFKAELWGYTLVEFGHMDENGEFIDCQMFPRANFYPKNKHIIIQETDTEGIPYGDNPGKFFLLELGKPDNIGKFETIAREVIWKMFARGDWSAVSSKWGSPHLVIDTDAEGDELKAIKYQAADFGNQQNIVGDFNGRTPIIIESKNTGNGYLMFEKNARFCDEQISKVMNGQTGSSDNQAWSGTADVHEDVLEDWHLARLRRYTNIINYKLIPFLIGKGYPLDGATGRYAVLDPKTNANGANNNTGKEGYDLEDGPSKTGKPGEDVTIKKPAAASRPW